MGINFRRTKSLGKGVNLTISKSGPSISFGKKGARVSVNKNGVRGSTGIPGTGASYSKSKSFKKGSSLKRIAEIVAGIVLAGIIICVMMGYL